MCQPRSARRDDVAASLLASALHLTDKAAGSAVSLIANLDGPQTHRNKYPPDEPNHSGAEELHKRHPGHKEREAGAKIGRPGSFIGQLRALDSQVITQHVRHRGMRLLPAEEAANFVVIA